MEFDCRDFYMKQIAHYKMCLDYSDREIAYINRSLKRIRESDRGVTEYVWSKGVLSEMEMEIWGDQKTYRSAEYEEEYARREKCYRSRSRERKMLAHYQKLLVGSK